MYKLFTKYYYFILLLLNVYSNCDVFFFFIKSLEINLTIGTDCLLHGKKYNHSSLYNVILNVIWYKIKIFLKKIRSK